MKKGKSRNNGLLPSSLRIISSCLKTVSTNASTVASSVRSAGASVAATISAASEDHKDQVIWAGFDKLELGPSGFKKVLLVGYQNGFQVLDVEDASNFSELVSKRDGPVTFLQMQPFPAKSDGDQGFRKSHPLLLVVAGDETNNLNQGVNHTPSGRSSRDGSLESQISGNFFNSPTEVRFYSLRCHSYVHVLRFRSAVCMVRCSPRIVAVGLATQIYCFDALTLENKFSVLTYPVPQLGGQGTLGVNIGYGPMAVGPRWLAYASNNPLMLNTGRISPKNLSPSPGGSPSTSPGNGTLVARYAMESSKHLAAGIINLGDKGYKTLSRYYQDLLPDGSSSPVSASSGWKAGRPAATETDTAGMVIIKDYVSRAVISQFKAHTSPISALCFDPSGTLLVTASVYGNNINIFRIMPTYLRSGSGSQNYDWSSSHVHLYKLHRGMTSAIIRDICFSNYSQWVAIVSSKGTCHIFVLSPFGGDAGFQTLNSQSEEPSLLPIISPPWWSSSSLIVNQQSYPPPVPVSLSVVSRIRDSYSGWLNTVNNAAASATGKASLPSGAFAAVFHNSITQSHQHVNVKVKSLEHLLVYTPSGHVIQHGLRPSIGADLSDSASKIRSGSVMQTQDEDLRVKVDHIQWWDVCRRSDWPEREECISGPNFDRQEASEKILPRSECGDSYRSEMRETSSDGGDKKLVKTDPVNPNERSHWYLSNAEVQINSGRLPIWQKSKICFFTMDPPRVDSYAAGEFEVEKIPVNEVEIRRKDLLPVFDHFHSIKSGWNDRGLAGGRYPNNTSLLEPHQAKGKLSEETVICHSKPASLSSTESSDGGSSRRIENLLDLDHIQNEKSYIPTCQISDEFSPERKGIVLVDHSILSNKTITTTSLSSNRLKNDDCHIDNRIIEGFSSLGSNFPSVGRAIAERVPSSDSSGYSAGSMSNVECFDSASNILEEGQTSAIVHNPVDFGQCFQEEYCKASDLEGCCRSGVTDDVDSSSGKCDRETSEEDGESDEMFGAMFAFSEEG